MGASQHVLQIKSSNHFQNYVLLDLAELVGVTGHLLEGLVVLFLPAVKVDALPPLAAVAVLGAVVHVTKIIRKV